MGAQYWNSTKQVASQPGVPSDQTDKRRDKSDPLELNLTAGKKLSDLSLLNPLNVSVAGIINMIVMPDNKTI
jgi:hypothetical protein